MAEYRKSFGTSPRTKDHGGEKKPDVRAAARRSLVALHLDCVEMVDPLEKLAPATIPASTLFPSVRARGLLNFRVEST